MATPYTWTTSSSADWNTSADWSPTNPPGPPTSVDSALISAGGTYTVTVSNADSINIVNLTISSAKATVEVDGKLIGGSAGTFAVSSGILSVLNAGTVGVNTGGLGLAGTTSSTATVTVSGANSRLTDSGGINVGINGSGLLQVLNAGTIELTGTNGITTGVSAASAGTVVVSGAGSVLQLDTTAAGMTVGNLGSGTVEALSGGTITLRGTGGILIGGSTIGPNLLLVSGTGSVLNQTANGARIAIGGSIGSSGTLEVLSGGSVTLDGTRVANSDSLTGFVVGKLGTGIVLVDGTGSSLTLGNGVTIGYGANGTLTVQNHGSVSNTGTSNFDIGFGVSESGALVINDGTLTNTNGNFIIGGSNTAGSLVVQGAGVLTTGNGGPALSSINGIGFAIASAAINGGTWDVNGALHVAEDGGGVLDIKTDGTSSGVVNTGTFGIEIASTKSGGSGTITVENGGTLSGGQLQIADFSSTTGALSIATGGVATVSNGTIGSGGTVSLTGGTLSAGGLTQVNGSIDGFGTLIAGLNNSGTVTANGGRLVVTGSVGGTGAINIDGGATMEVDSGLGFSQAVTFVNSATAEALQLNLLLSQSQGFGLSNWQGGDQLFIANGVTVTGAQWLAGSGNSGTLDVITNGGTYDFNNVTLAAGATPSFTTGSNFVELVCFARGTRIATPNGEVAVEQLAVGDPVLTLDGKAEPIVWIGTGRQLVTPGRRSAATPVIVRKGALADNVPHRDLRVTKGHSLYIDDVLIPVEFLVNHRSIIWDDRAREIEIYHIELAQHAVLLADGAPAESYRDDGNRWLFENAHAMWHLPPQAPCAPVLTGGRVVDAVWRRLLERDGPRRGMPLTDEPDLHLMIEGKRIDVAWHDATVQAFQLRVPRTAARMVSLAAVPQELGLTRDARCLGIALRRIVLRQGTQVRTIDAEDARLTEGFHAFEPDERMRWTDGEAVLPVELFAGFTGRIELEVHLGCTTQYLADAAVGRAA